MRIVQLSAHTKQALLALILVGAILLTFFATKAWAMENDRENSGGLSSQSSTAQRRVHVEDFVSSTTTSTTTTTLPSKRVQSVSSPVEASPIRQASGDVWEALRNCEAGGNYSRNSGNGYYGAYQFSAPTWRSMNTGYEFAHLAPPAVQDDAAKRLQASSGWGQWPACSKKIGVR